MSRWPEVALGEVLVERRETPDAASVELGAIPVVAKIGFDSGRIEFRETAGTKTGMILIRPGDLVVSGINAVKGAIAWHADDCETDAAATIHYGAYEVRRDRADPRYLWWLLRSPAFRDTLARHVPGGVKTELKAKRLLPVPIPLPSIEEQRRVAQRINQLAAGTRRARRLSDHVDAAAIALLPSASRFRIDLRQWPLLPLGECCEALIDYRGRTPPLTDSGIPHITSANIRGGRISWETSKYVTEETYARYMTRGIPRPGDVLFTMEAPLGEAAVLEVDRRFSLAQRTMLLRVRAEILRGDYFALALMAPQVREAIYERATGTTVKGIAAKRLRHVPIPVPSMEDQARTVGALRNLRASRDRLVGSMEARQIALEAVLPSVLGAAFDERAAVAR